MFQRTARATIANRWRDAIGIGAFWLAAPALGQSSPAPTPAGTTIVNVAHVVFSNDGIERQLASNPVTLIVAERLDVGLVRSGDAVAQITATPVAIPVVLTNRGTGQEAFAVTASGSTATAVVRGIAIDRDGDGRFDPAIDTMLGDATPPLAPGEALTLVAVLARAGDAAATPGTMTLTAQATTGSGTTDALFAGAGDDGGDAIVGPTGAIASVSIPFTGTAAPGPTLVKAQRVRAPGGGTAPVSGAVVTYTLTARFPDGPTRDARIDDPVPAATVYLPGTLTLDGQALTDADDGDAGRVVDGRVTVTLGTVAAAAAHEVGFQVRLP